MGLGSKLSLRHWHRHSLRLKFRYSKRDSACKWSFHNWVIWRMPFQRGYTYIQKDVSCRSPSGKLWKLFGSTHDWFNWRHYSYRYNHNIIIMQSSTLWSLLSIAFGYKFLCKYFATMGIAFCSHTNCQFVTRVWNATPRNRDRDRNRDTNRNRNSYSYNYLPFIVAENCLFIALTMQFHV